ncbi:MAG: hypothetical protein R6V50_06495 [Thermoplasmatota archaeon]
MNISGKLLLFSILTILCFIVGASFISSAEEEIPFWNTQWSYRQEITIPISTDSSHAHYQPIDLSIEFTNACWTNTAYETSIRILCWHENKWIELESQIYDIKKRDEYFIDTCNVVFLIPPFADGTEKYFIYYDDTQKPSVNYPDRVTIKDLEYSASPISGIIAEARYFGIMQGKYCIYGIGQDGTLLDRSFSNIIIKQEKDVTKFDLFNSDQIVSFAFSYFDGPQETDEISSDQSFVHKEIFIDGNLMIKFGIISESENKNLRTIAIYTYYYSPTPEKRIYAHIKHMCTEDVTVSGQANIDGRFGAMFSFKSRNPSISRMNFGDIFPLLRVYGKHNTVEEYQIDTNPSSKEREWIISYEDNVDLGKEAWFSLSDDRTGKANAIIFSSNKGIVKSGANERDGIQLKVAVKNYLNVLGTKIDYATINFGRNSYEKGQTHNLNIPNDLVVEFHAEVFSTEDKGFQSVQKEASYYQQLIAHRTIQHDSSFEEKQKQYQLEVITHRGGTRFTFPWLKSITNFSLPILLVELYQEDNLMYSGYAKRSILFRGISSILFPEVSEGEYLIKVFWMRDNSTKYFRGARVVNVDEDKKIHVFCTYERLIHVSFFDSNENPLEGIYTLLLNEDHIIFDSNITNNAGEVVLKAPYSANPYTLKAYYRDILIYDDLVRNTLRNVIIDLDISLYDFTVEIKDIFGLHPGVDLSPFVVSYGDKSTFEFTAEKKQPGIFYFSDIPSGLYSLRVTYGSFFDELIFEVPVVEEYIVLDFSAQYEITFQLYTTQGISFSYSEVNFKVHRNERYLSDFNTNSFILPPGIYQIQAYADQEFIGSKEIELTNSKTINFVTNIQSIIPLIVNIVALLCLAICFFLLFKKVINILLFLKLIAIIFIVICLLQPWWGFYGVSSSPSIEHTSQIFISPQVMMEQTNYHDRTEFEIAEMPELYVDVLSKIMIVLFIVCILLVFSFIFLKIRKNNYSFFIDFLCLLMLVVVLSVFITGTIRLCEISIGEVQGSGTIGVSVNQEIIMMQSSWGFITGFYLFITSILLVFTGMLIELKNRVYRLTKKNR